MSADMWVTILQDERGCYVGVEDTERWVIWSSDVRFPTAADAQKSADCFTKAREFIASRESEKVAVDAHRAKLLGGAAYADPMGSTRDAIMAPFADESEDRPVGLKGTSLYAMLSDYADNKMPDANYPEHEAALARSLLGVLDNIESLFKSYGTGLVPPNIDPEFEKEYGATAND